MAISQEWLDENRHRFDPCFESGREVRDYLRENGIDVDRLVKYARYRTDTAGVFFRVQLNFEALNEDYDSYKKGFEEIEELLGGTNAGPH